MEDIDIDKLAEAIVRKQNEAAERKAMADAEAAKAAAKEAAEQAELSRVAAEKEAAEQAERDRIAEAKQKHIGAILSAKPGDVFVDEDGNHHRVIGVVDGGIDTVSRDRDGGVIGNWRSWRPGEHETLLGWRKKG